MPKADVVIVNPTHYAVAIKYDTTLSEAPFVVAKGIDEVAMHIQTIAKQHDVEILHSPPLTRAIYHSTQISKRSQANSMSPWRILTYVYSLKPFDKVKEINHKRYQFCYPKTFTALISAHFYRIG